MRRYARWAVGLGIALSAFSALGVEVDHKPVDCIVAGKYSRLNACFTPAGSVGRARLYFKIHASATWYYVDMQSEAPCYAGVLPKAKKSLVPQKLQYYIQVFDKSMAEGRSMEYAPTIVASEGECGSDKILAPLSGVGPAAVFPALPAGFVAGAGATPLVIGGVAAAGAVGTGVALATKGGDPATAPTPVPTPTPTPIPIPTPTPPPPPAALEVSCSAEPSSGPAPLSVQFGATPAGGTGIYDYKWEFGTGESSNEKRIKYTYLSDGTFDAVLTVKSGSQAATCRTRITVGKVAPTVTVKTEWNTSYSFGKVTSSPTGIYCSFSATAGVSGTCSSAFPTGAPLTLSLSCTSTLATPEWLSGCVAPNGSPTCTFTPTADTIVSLKCYETPPVRATGEDSPNGRLRTSLEAAGARGRVVVDGIAMVPVESGGPRQVEVVRTGAHRIEAVLDEVRGPGLWRFDIAGSGVPAGSIRVLFGEVVLLGPESVVFRLSGRAGERIAFTVGESAAAR